MASKVIRFTNQHTTHFKQIKCLYCINNTNNTELYAYIVTCKTNFK